MVRWVVVAAVGVMLTAGPALAQAPSLSPTPIVTPAKSSHSWTYFMAFATIGIAALTLIMTALCYLVQAPGFRRVQRQSGPATPPQAS